MPIRVNIPVRHKGMYFESGSVVSDADMDAKSQARLVENGVAEYVTTEKPAPQKKGKKGDA